MRQPDWAQRRCRRPDIVSSERWLKPWRDPMTDPFSTIPVGEKHAIPSAGPNLGELLSAEIAGRVTYALASDRVELLRQVEEEHRGAAEALRTCLRQNGWEAPAHAASLGVWAAAARAAIAGELPA